MNFVIAVVAVLASALFSAAACWLVLRRLQVMQSTLQGRIDQIDRRMAESRMPPVEPAPEAPLEQSFTPFPSELNFTEKSKVLKLSRAGRTDEQIAATLQLPAAKVRMLLKIAALTRQGEGLDRVSTKTHTRLTEQIAFSHDMEDGEARGARR